jgi:hypothetical protein
MRKGFLTYEKMSKYLPIYEEIVATDPFCCLTYEENFIFFFISDRGEEIG